VNSGVRGQKSGRAILTAYPLYADPPLQGWLPAQGSRVNVNTLFIHLP